MPDQGTQSVAILGAGSWGTALALYLARRGQQVNIWSIDKSEIEAMLADKANHRYLPGIPLPDLIRPTADLATAIKQVQDIIVVVPSVGFRQTLLSLQPLLQATQRIVCATKGLDASSGQFLSEVASDILGPEMAFAALSGPSFAGEVAAGLPCAVIIASHDKNFVSELITRFQSDLFHAYPSNDVIGVEVGGIVKNVIAIATGMVDGLALGANTRSAIITLGLEEKIRLGLALGAKRETLYGLSGLGDLVLTTTDDQSRNRRFGLAIGRGQSAAQAEQQIAQVIEGKQNAELIYHLAKKHQVAMPICTTVWRVLQGELSAREAWIHFFRRQQH